MNTLLMVGEMTHLDMPYELDTEVVEQEYIYNISTHIRYQRHTSFATARCVFALCE